MCSVTLLASKAVCMLELNAELESIYPLLRKLSPLQKKLYGLHPGPQLSLQYDPRGYWHLWTTIPEADYTHSAEWSANSPLSKQDETELRQHMLGILKQWIHEDSLFADPMAKQDVVRILGLNKTGIEAGVKTLNRQLKSGVLRAIVLDKNTIRVLKADLPKF